MKKHQCRIKFGKDDKIICASEVLCSGCPEKDKCEEVDLYIKDRYEENYEEIMREKKGVNL